MPTHIRLTPDLKPQQPSCPKLWAETLQSISCVNDSKLDLHSTCISLNNKSRFSLNFIWFAPVSFVCLVNPPSLIILFTWGLSKSASDISFTLLHMICLCQHCLETLWSYDLIGQVQTNRGFSLVNIILHFECQRCLYIFYIPGSIVYSRPFDLNQLSCICIFHFEPLCCACQKPHKSLLPQLSRDIISLFNTSLLLFWHTLSLTCFYPCTALYRLLS